jgi:hypothetical protein
MSISVVLMLLVKCFPILIAERPLPDGQIMLESVLRMDLRVLMMMAIAGENTGRKIF